MPDRRHILLLLPFLLAQSHPATRPALTITTFTAEVAAISPLQPTDKPTFSDLDPRFLLTLTRLHLLTGTLPQSPTTITYALHSPALTFSADSPLHQTFTFTLQTRGPLSLLTTDHPHPTTAPTPNTLPSPIK